ncbi:MAG: hypothetical protein JSS53_05375 [Proteobacteria bacterium]|nr:hypothetical protein [Pseudomonadota bacterium]
MIIESSKSTKSTKLAKSREFYHSLLKAFWTKGNAAMYAAGLQLLYLYIAIEFHRETTDPDNPGEYFPSIYFQMMILMAFGFVDSFRLANQVIDNGTARFVNSAVPKCLPIPRYTPSDTFVDRLGKNSYFRIFTGMISIATIPLLNHLAVMAYVRELGYDNTHDFLLGADVGLGKVPNEVAIAASILIAVLSVPSTMFTHAGDLTETHPSSFLDFLKEWINCFIACFKCFCSKEENPPMIRQLDKEYEEEQKVKRRHTLVERTLEYFTIYMSSFFQAIPTNQMIYLYPICKALDDLKVGDDWALALGITLIPAAIAASVNTALSQLQVNRNFFVGEEKEISSVCTFYRGLQPNKWITRLEKVAQLGTAIPATAIQCLGTILAIEMLLNGWFQLDEKVMQMFDEFEIPVTTIISVFVTISTLLFTFFFSTCPVLNRKANFVMSRENDSTDGMAGKRSVYGSSDSEDNGEHYNALSDSENRGGSTGVVRKEKDEETPFYSQNTKSYRS